LVAGGDPVRKRAFGFSIRYDTYDYIPYDTKVGEHAEKAVFLLGPGFSVLSGTQDSK
jgi:hypothetical protein